VIRDPGGKRGSHDVFQSDPVKCILVCKTHINLFPLISVFWRLPAFPQRRLLTPRHISSEACFDDFPVFPILNPDEIEAIITLVMEFPQEEEISLVRKLRNLLRNLIGIFFVWYTKLEDAWVNRKQTWRAYSQTKRCLIDISNPMTIKAILKDFRNKNRMLIYQMLSVAMKMMEKVIYRMKLRRNGRVSYDPFELKISQRRQDLYFQTDFTEQQQLLWIIFLWIFP